MVVNPAPSRGRWQVWTSAPHRVMFLPGAVMLVASIAYVFAELGGRSFGWWPTPPWSVPPAWGHAYLMLFGLFPWFIFGFGMTAVPNWTGHPVARSSWVAAAMPMIAGLSLFSAGLFVSSALVLAGGVLHLAGWFIAAFAIGRVVHAGRWRDPYAAGLVILLASGFACAALFLAGLHLGEGRWIEVAQGAGLWLFLLPVFLLVSHRLIPFFSSRVIDRYGVYKPSFSLPLLLVLCAAHFALESSGLFAWTWLADLPMAAWTGWLAIRWGLVQSFRAKLLAMLHVSLAMLSLGLGLHALASIAALGAHAALFGRGPLHLLAIAYFSAMAIGMVSRVSLGHSGRALEADRVTWYGFLVVIAVGLVRALADFEPLAGAPRAWLIVLCAVAWIAVTGAWAARVVPIYLAPRKDGRPG